MAGRTLIRALSAVVAGAVLAAVSAVAALGADGSVSIVEVDEQYRYEPADISIQVGDSVTWTNDSDAPHTVTSDGGGPLGSDIFEQGQTYEATFDAAGDYAYHCEVHPEMTGVVHVASGPTGGGGPSGNGGEPPPTDMQPAGAGAGEGVPVALLLVIAIVAAIAAASFMLRSRTPAPR